MSRIGKKPIQIPAKVKVEVKGDVVKATGPLGSLSYTIPQGITAKLEGAVLSLHLEKELVSELNAVYGTTRARIASIINGVETAFVKNLEM